MLRSTRRTFHSSCQRFTPNTVLYGWGQTQALPLSEGHMDRVFNRPVCLKNEKDYALPRDQRITHVATGWGHSLFGTESNQVYAFGLNQSGQLGTLGVGSQVLANEQEKLKFLACGREHSHIVTESSDESTQLYSFGNNMYGQLGLGKNKNTHPGKLIAEQIPRLVPFKGDKVDHIQCGLDHTIFSTIDGSIYGMGWSADGQLGQGKDDKDRPSRLGLSMKVKKLSSSTDFTLALGQDGKLWTWGNSEYGQGIQGKVIDRILEPLEIHVSDVVDIAAGGPFSVLLTKDGNVHTCGYGALGLGQDTIQTLELKQIEGLNRISKVYATTDYAAAITVSGELYMWGLNGIHSRLGLGNHEHAFIPQRVELDKKIVDLFLGTNHAIAMCLDN
ncbi:regulator of chromosome condensation 1/beta-lactamase-inhibitor protein II [Gilbertella persicaria]|uniref:regulator of chromosome condensation 1/beta-lactamase-inhibitor protein II n=1 Tax=Gilbertella persicaria TaxID=101096 RepID=UPI0022210670|nr:regulator of chromosome condensation 1/beta-lactamase-inhibitor protein II [Gilbertella persicaria]KAI8049434.1 regulator of chromosome condensation 1/beta-lactamase-inhibitor protein II [Gilbertella persicaria]